MPTYVVLLRYTTQGISTIKDSPRRLDAVKAAFRAAGGEIKAYYLTMGRFDEVVVIEAPDDATFTKLILAVAAQGNVQTETLRAFTEDEYRSIIAGLP
ncbi:MAG: GYD domain-containing protein [Chloroflexota bacterium]|jgi:uncharacterized protein with GYD domain